MTLDEAMSGPNDIFVPWHACIDRLIENEIIEKVNDDRYSLKKLGFLFPCRIIK